MRCGTWPRLRTPVGSRVMSMETASLAGLRWPRLFLPGWHRERYRQADMRRHDGGDLVARTPGGHEQDPFRPAEPEARPVGLPGERADLVPQRPPDVGLGPPRRGEKTLVLLAEHDRQVGDAPHLVLPQRAVEEEHPRQVVDNQLGNVAAR